MSRIVARRAIAIGILAVSLGICAVGFGADRADASPKGYDVERLLRQGVPVWLHDAAPRAASAPYASQPQAPYAPQLQPQAPLQPQPLNRLPNVPAPSIFPGEPDLVTPPPLQTQGLSGQPPLDRARLIRAAPARPQPHAQRRAQARPNVIYAPGKPRSTVSGAWTPR